MVATPTPPRAPTRFSVPKSLPGSQLHADPDPSTLPHNGTVNQIVTTDAAKFGYKGRLLGYIANADLRTAGELLSNQLQKAAGGEFGEAPAEMVSSYLRSMAPVGQESCGGSCLKCPRGGGQLAICATLLDREVMHGGLELVRDGKIRILMQPTGVGLSDSTAGNAKFDAPLQFGHYASKPWQVPQLGCLQSLFLHIDRPQQHSNSRNSAQDRRNLSSTEAG